MVRQGSARRGRGVDAATEAAGRQGGDDVDQLGHAHRLRHVKLEPGAPDTRAMFGARVARERRGGQIPRRRLDSELLSARVAA
jgi:hypothetical protein